MDKPLFIMTSSHMDREWYMPMDMVRVFFGEVLDRAFELLERLPNFTFYVDGQTAVLLDYLESRPDRLEEVKKYVAEGRLEVGPWHTQSDERIPVGESHIRNLLIGRKECEKLGGRLMLGYLPDTFGHIGQSPQILKQFGIDHAFLMRAISDTGCGRDFIWRGEDGSELICVGCEYGNGGGICDFSQGLRDGLPALRTAEEFEINRKKAMNDPNARAPYALLLINGDNQTLPRNLDELGPDHFNTWDELFAEVEKYRDRYMTIEGELYYSSDIQYLQDTLATRMYLKTQNAAAQSMVGRIAEPLACIAYPKNKTYKGHMQVAWKYLVENHTHDGVTGCHGDRTANELESRFAKSMALAEQVRNFAIEDIADAMDTSFAGEDAVCVFHPRAGKGDVFVPFSLRLDDWKEKKYLRLFDEKGNEAPVYVERCRRVGDIRSNKRAQQMFRQTVQYDGYAILKDLPAMGMKAYKIVASDEKPMYAGVTAWENGAENRFIRMEIENGTITLTDKRNGRVYRGLGALMDRGNMGDGYNFVPDGRENDVPCVGRLDFENGAMARFVFEGKDVCWTAMVAADDPRVYVKMTMDNHEKDHALYARFPTGMAAGESFRDQAYTVETGAMGTMPTLTFAGFREGEKGLAVLHKGLHRAEFLEGGEMRLTVLQCQGRLYRGFFPVNHNDEFDGCQILRKIDVEFAIQPLDGGEDLFASASEFVDGVSMFKTVGHEGTLGREWSFMEVSGAVQSAMKMEENGERVLVRLYNPTNEAVTARIDLMEGAKNPVRMRLDETETGPADLNHFVMKSKEIATIAFEFGGIL